MSYTSFFYLVFIAVTCTIYYLFRPKYRWMILLAANLIFYLSSGWDNLIFLLISITISYWVSLKMWKLNNEFKMIRNQGNYDRKELKEINEKYQKKREHYLWGGLAVVLLILIAVKYINFILDNVYSMMNLLEIENNEFFIKLIMPLGISFYTFQIISYMVDSYNGNIEPQRNLLKYALYSSFFPSIVQGPIPRYGDLGAQLNEEHRFDYNNIRDGCILILLGFAKKLILAERLAIFVDAIYNHYTSYDGIILAIATVAYSIQIYADFSSCMDIAIGSARLFGIKLAPNFLRPYFSRTMPEFWRRWHATLGAWFKDYVFYPFSISNVSLKLNKKARKIFGNGIGRIIASSVPILIVWMLTGIWHGAEWKYVIWGLFHGTLIILSMIFTPYNEKLAKKLKIRMNCLSFRLYQISRTFLLCCVGRVFFRADSFGAAIEIFKRMFSKSGLWRIFKGNIYNYGLNENNMHIVILAIVVSIAISILEEKEDMLTALNRQNLIFRWVLIYILIFSILIFGNYGSGYDASEFIYEQF